MVLFAPGLLSFMADAESELKRFVITSRSTASWVCFDRFYTQFHQVRQSLYSTPWSL
jgi:hypothetical protein